MLETSGPQKTKNTVLHIQSLVQLSTSQIVEEYTKYILYPTDYTLV